MGRPPRKRTHGRGSEPSVRHSTSLKHVAVLGQTRLYCDCLVRALKQHAVTCLDILKRIAGRLASVHGPTGAQRPLSAREREVLEFVKQGLTNKEIARRLGVETATVKNHVHNIMAKLSVHRRLDAAAQLPGPPTERIE